MEKWKVLIDLGGNEKKLKLEITVKIDNNMFYKEDKMMNAIKDMIRYIMSGDTNFLYKYLEDNYLYNNNKIELQ